MAKAWMMAAVLLGSSVAAVCQSTLPPMAPTMREIEEHPATVEYADGRIAVRADNSSLNDILREIARRAGMAVEGSVVEERVFGKYGPGAPAEVVSALLVGTGTNIMLASGALHAPHLILTPKHGELTASELAAERQRADARERERREAEETAAKEEAERTRLAAAVKAAVESAPADAAGGTADGAGLTAEADSAPARNKSEAAATGAPGLAEEVR